MSRTRTAYLTVLLAVSLTCTGWFFVRNGPQVQPAEYSQTEVCDSCTARHQSLTRLLDARSLSEGVDK